MPHISNHKGLILMKNMRRFFKILMPVFALGVFWLILPFADRLLAIFGQIVAGLPPVANFVLTLQIKAVGSLLLFSGAEVLWSGEGLAVGSRQLPMAIFANNLSWQMIIAAAILGIAVFQRSISRVSRLKGALLGIAGSFLLVSLRTFVYKQYGHFCGLRWISSILSRLSLLRGP